MFYCSTCRMQCGYEHLQRHRDEEAELILAFITTEAMLHAAGHWTKTDQGMFEAQEIERQLDHIKFGVSDVR